ncbi:efflux transporter outer membrane subunit [Marinobacter sp. 1Y8]
MAKSSLPLSALIALLLAGCAVGPDYQAPQADAPNRFNEVRNPQSFDAQAEQRFWQGFDDPMLADLIRQSLSANYNLQIAVARYERAQALLRGAERNQLPSVTASGSVSENHLAEVERTGTADDVTLYQVGAVAHWELDLFGRLQRITEAQGAELDAAGADLNAVQVALVGQLASSYFELRGLQQQLLVAQRNLDNQQQTLDIVSSRLEAGRGTHFDTVRAQAQLEMVRSTIPSLEAGARARMHRIAVLTGQQPTALIEILAEAKPLPEVVPAIPVGSPGGVLRRRPDVRAAERRLAAATAGIGVATADLFPRFSLDALIGSVADSSGDLFTGGAASRRVTLGIDWTFLDFERVQARIDVADADARGALANYRQTVLSVLEETETLLVQYHRAQTRTHYLSRATEAANEAARLARQRYREGLIGYFEVLDAEQELIDTRDSLIQSRTSVTLGMVNLYRALAGAPQSAEETAMQTVVE